MSRPYRVWVEVVLDANSPEQAQQRVKKALVCLDNSLAYANAGTDVPELPKPALCPNCEAEGGDPKTDSCLPECPEGGLR